MDKGFRGIPVGVDLNAVNHIGHVYGIEDSGGADVHRQDPVRPDYGLSSMEHFFSHCGSLWWRPSCSYIALRRAISNNVVCSTYLSGESPRYRSLFVGAGRKTLSHGSAGTCQSFDSGRRQRISRLAHLRRFRSKADRSSKKALCRGELRGRHLNTAYALDATTIDLCLSMFPWAPFRTAKAAVKVHTLMDLRGSIPSFIHISDGKLHDVNVLDLLIPEAGAFYVMDRAYLDFERLYVLHQAESFFVTRAKSNLDARRLYSASTDRSTGVICDQTIVSMVSTAADTYPHIYVESVSRTQSPAKHCCFSPITIPCQL